MLLIKKMAFALILGVIFQSSGLSLYRVIYDIGYNDNVGRCGQIITITKNH